MKGANRTLVHSAVQLEAAKKLVAEATKPKSLQEQGEARSVKMLTAHIARKRSVAVGLWDLGAWLGGLVELVSGLNRAQEAFCFFVVKATVPVGLISKPERVVTWLTKEHHKRLSRTDRQDVENNIIANEYFGLAGEIRKDLSLDLVVGVTPSMVAAEDDGALHWNYFSYDDDRTKTILVSTYGLREYEKQTNWRFEAYLAALIIAEVLCAKSRRLDYHSENTGCLFDFNGDRDSIMKQAHHPMIEPRCRELISPAYRDAADGFVKFLARFGKMDK